jgi:hypothetical protein
MESKKVVLLNIILKLIKKNPSREYRKIFLSEKIGLYKTNKDNMKNGTELIWVNAINVRLIINNKTLILVNSFNILTNIKYDIKKIIKNKS